MLTALQCLMLAAGCASYEAAPIDSRAVLEQREALQIDKSAVRDELAKLAPSVEWDGTRWDSLSLLAAALVSNPQIAQARATVVAVRADENTANQAPGPTLVLATEYALNAPESSPWLFGVAADFTIDTGARRDARVVSAQLNTKMAVFEFMDVAWSVRQVVHRSLADALVSRQERALAAEIVLLAESQLQAMQRRLAAGAANSFDVQRARAELALSRQQLIGADAREAMAIAQLASALGVSSGALDTEGLFWPDIDSAERLPDPVSQACRQDALLARPDIARASANYDQAEQALRSAVASQYPALHVAPGYIWERGLKKLPFGLSLALPPMDLNRAAIDAADARRAEAGSQLEATVYAAMSAVEQAEETYRAAQVQLDNARQQTEIATRLASKAGVAIASGAINRVDWRVSEMALLNAKLTESTAVRNLRFAEAGFEEALRRPLTGPELAIAPSQSTTEKQECNSLLSAQSLSQ